MNKELKSIMLIDDNRDDNFIHERAIRKISTKSTVITKESGVDALTHLKSLKSLHADLIFLDINMPEMNGWEFLAEYSKLDKELQCKSIIIMLTTSDNEDDVAKAKTMNNVKDFITKPLTKEKMSAICEKYFIPPCA
ncbi:MAG TPA: response regulator [Cyclobacteriaceae bacterium]|nr:response regulator [Cyclobacteriaceae bacterium]